MQAMPAVVRSEGPRWDVDDGESQVAAAYYVEGAVSECDWDGSGHHVDRGERESVHKLH